MTFKAPLPLIPKGGKTAVIEPVHVIGMGFSPMNFTTFHPALIERAFVSVEPNG
jgi:hypothetical protein